MPGPTIRLPFTSSCGVLLALCCIPFATAAATLPTTDLISQYKASSFDGAFNDGDTITSAWIDSQGGKNATVFGTPVYNDSFGFSSVSFVQGEEESFDASSLPGISGTDGFTYWIVINATSFSPGDVDKGNASYFYDRNVDNGNFSDEPLVSLKTDGTKFGFQKRFNDSSGLGGPISTTDVDTTPGNFQVVTLRRNRTDDRFEIWVDGNLEGQEVDANGNLDPDPIAIGNHNNNDRGFTGDIAEILIFGSEQTSDDFNQTGFYLEQEYGLDTAFVPEPSTIILGLMAVAGLTVLARRRRP